MASNTRRGDNSGGVGNQIGLGLKGRMGETEVLGGGTVDTRAMEGEV